MSNRTGLSAEVPTLDLCREMRRIPALKEAFADCPVAWNTEVTVHVCDCCGEKCIPAPTVREMLAWLLKNDCDWTGECCRSLLEDATDPDALARACIEAAK